MKPPPFQYHDPKTIAEAVSLLGSLDNAKLEIAQFFTDDQIVG